MNEELKVFTFKGREYTVNKDKDEPRESCNRCDLCNYCTKPFMLCNDFGGDVHFVRLKKPNLQI